MTAVLHAWLYGRFREIQSNFRRKKLQRTNQDSDFLGRSFSNTDNKKAPIQFIFIDFFSRTDLAFFTSIAQVLLGQ